MVTLCDRRGRFSNLIFDSNVLISSHRWCPCGLVWVLAMAGRAYLLRSLHRSAYGLQIWDAVLSAERSDRGSTGRSTGEGMGSAEQAVRFARPRLRERSGPSRRQARRQAEARSFRCSVRPSRGPGLWFPQLLAQSPQWWRREHVASQVNDLVAPPSQTNHTAPVSQRS